MFLQAAASSWTARASGATTRVRNALSFLFHLPHLQHDYPLPRQARATYTQGQLTPQNGVSFHFVSSRLVSSRLVLFRLVSRFVSSRLVSSRLVSSRLVSSHLVSSRLVSSRLVLSRLVSRFVSSRLVSSRLSFRFQTESRSVMVWLDHCADPSNFEFRGKVGEYLINATQLPSPG
eukprot:COSAG06_NODE_134_length_22423_cov_17.315445_1_plen_176_part_00